MPEENKNQGGAQNKLGELFVEFSTKGLPSLLKNLNSVSASFLIGKNAATQFADTLTKPFKEAGNTAVGIGKMANALGATNREYQKLATYVKSKNVSEGILGDVERFNDIFTKLQTGQGGLPEGVVREFANLGLSPEDYLGDYESTIRLLNDIRDRTNGLTKQGRNLAFSNLGMSSEWGYLFDRGDFNLSDAFSLPDDVIEKNTKAAESLAELTLAFDQLKSLLIADFAPALTDTVNTLKNFVQNFDRNKENIKKTTSVIGGAAAGAAVGSVVPVVGTATGAIVGGVAGAGKYAIENAHKAGKPNQKEIPTWKQLTDFGQYKDGAPTGGAAPVPDFMNTPAATIPPGMNNLSQNITITNQNNITGDNAQEIATEIARINAQDIEYTQYQLQNLTGI